jgi:FkbM family methyltransferase
MQAGMTNEPSRALPADDGLLSDLPRRVQGEKRLFNAVAAALPGYSFTTIFDVGANIGQTCVPMAVALPQARIIAFEPVPATFAALSRNAAGYPAITPVNAALGAHSGEAVMSAEGVSTGNRILKAEDASSLPTTRVPVITGLEACEKHGVAHISLLKIDAEGFDIKVLDGFLPIIDRIDFIKVEAGMNDYNKTHVPFQDFYFYLSRRGFHLFHIYEQRFEFKKGGRPVLRRANPVFINGRLADLTGIS